MKKKRIALLFIGDIYKIRGEVTAIHNRIKALQKENKIIVDAYVFGEYFDKFTCFIKKIKQIELKSTFEFDGVIYCCKWYKRSHLDNITHKLFKCRTHIEISRIVKFAREFKEYDLIYANSLFTSYIGLELKEKEKIPFICMWHGSSIHTLPFKDKSTMKYTRRILESADLNLFVSDELLDTAKRITDKFKGETSYNGIDTDTFRRLTDGERELLRQKQGISKEEKCVAFVGNCLPIKNVQYLPELFTSITKKVNRVRFFIVGKGAFAPLFADSNISVTYVNEVKNEDMPQWYNCMDLVVMPSINEGLPMTCLEATACGTPFVGSRVGAIANVVGIENTVEHNSEFNSKFAELCIKRLNAEKEEIVLPYTFKLSNIVLKERSILTSIIYNNNDYERDI